MTKRLHYGYLTTSGANNFIVLADGMTEDDARLHRAPPPSAVSRRLQAMFAAVGESDYIGEPVSMMAHSLQAAALSAKQHGDNEVTVAALLHDVGHAVGLEAGFPLGMNDCGIPEVRESECVFVRVSGRDWT